MTSTSFGARTPGPQQSFQASPCESREGSRLSDPPSLLAEGSGEALRVKKFAGQHTFKAPAAADFAKGMLPHQAPTAPDPNPLAKVGVAMESMIKAVKAFIGGYKSQTSSLPMTRKPE